MFIKKQQGISFIEMILSLVILSITFTGTLQVFGTVLNWSVYPFIEKQAIAIAQSIFFDVQQSQIQIENNTQETFDIGEIMPFYQDVTQKHFKVTLTFKPVLVQNNALQLWELELQHNQGDTFKFSRLTKR